MALHFSLQEYQRRQQQAREAMRQRGLNGLLLFNQASMYWLTGYDTFGFCFFQCLFFGADGRLALLTRSADLRQAQQTSVIEDIRIWVDRADATPGDDLRAMLEDLDQDGATLGIELDTVGLTAGNGLMVRRALEQFCALTDVSELITGLRAVKSPEEIACIRRAAELADDALDAALETTASGAFEGDILAAMQGAVFKGGGDYAGNEFIIGSGEAALLCRYASGRRHLDPDDQLTLEWAGAYRRYHAAMMRTVLVGRVSDQHRAMHAACREALEACEAAIRPGAPMGDVFDAHARVLDAAGYGPHRLNACGYGMSAVFTPCWMDPPLFYAGNPQVMAPDMVFFLHMILMDSDSGRAMTLGHSVLVTGSGCERLSRHEPDLIAL